jgi:hypothetical protein
MLPPAVTGSGVITIGRRLPEDKRNPQTHERQKVRYQTRTGTGTRLLPGLARFGRDSLPGGGTWPRRCPTGTVASPATRRSSQTAGMRRRPTRQAPTPRSAFAGFRFPCDVIVLAVRWYLRFGLSYRDVEELLAERGVEVDHVTIYRWVQRFTPLLVDAARPCQTRRRRPLAGGRDLCEGRRAMAVGVSGG